MTFYDWVVLALIFGALHLVPVYIGYVAIDNIVDDLQEYEWSRYQSESLSQDIRKVLRKCVNYPIKNWYYCYRLIIHHNGYVNTYIEFIDSWINRQEEQYDISDK